MQNWFESDVGRYVLKREQAWFDTVSADIFGFNAVQLSTCDIDYLRANRMPYRFCAGESLGHLHCQSEHLPLASQTVDLVAMPHLLEFSAHPHAVLREVERILRPEGRVLIAGFNPASLLGLRRVCSAHDAGWPWQGRFLHLTRLKDWLALLGFEIIGGRMACYAPPINRETWIRRFAFLEAAGDRWWALGGGVYLLHAVKRVHGMRLIEPKWDGQWITRPAFAATPRKTVMRTRWTNTG